jgi:BirA family transcriptional regulator, biotin operon repressor / biotin---[acetyl-CoA-carboxylase] ligase
MTDRRSPHALDAAKLMHDLGTRRVGRQIVVLPEAESTNAFVLDSLASEGGRLADGSVVFAEHQSAGRGRQGRTWESPRGASLLFTVLLWEEEARLNAARVVMCTALAVVEGVEQASEVEPRVRWPNDVYVRGKKLAGILIETRSLQPAFRAIALGIGLNCLQHAAHFGPELREKATSLELECAHAIDRGEMARAILRSLDRRFGGTEAAPDEALVAEWREHSDDIGARACLSTSGREFTGWIVDVHPANGLVLQLDTGGRLHFDPLRTNRR